MRRSIILSAAMLSAALAVSGEVLAAAGPAPGETLSQSYRGSQRDNVEYNKIAPIKVFDNLHYVGPGFVAVWLIPTSAGLILVDGAQEPYVDHVIDNIRRSGFDPRNIRYILITHGHLDHFGGVARLQELSGARVAAVAEDWQLIEEAAGRPGRGGTPAPRVPRRDMVVRDGDVITLGDTALKLYHTPGHTPGVLSAEFTVTDNGRPHKAFLWGGPGERAGLAGAEQGLASAKRVAQIPGIEVGIMVHGWLAPTYVYPNGGIFERAQRLAQRRPGEPHVFVDPASWNEFVRHTQAQTARAVETARQNPQAAPTP
jgi:L-ascorbate metabolism protein UlaG (beta-lactamase superfamily)